MHLHLAKHKLQLPKRSHCKQANRITSNVNIRFHYVILFKFIDFSNSFLIYSYFILDGSTNIAGRDVLANQANAGVAHSNVITNRETQSVQPLSHVSSSQNEQRKSPILPSNFLIYLIDFVNEHYFDIIN